MPCTANTFPDHLLHATGSGRFRRSFDSSCAALVFHSQSNSLQNSSRQKLYSFTLGLSFDAAGIIYGTNLLALFSGVIYNTKAARPIVLEIVPMSLEKADKASIERPENTVIAVVGPTCSGKTSLSIELSCVLNGEVIACDSRNIYRYMDIGTAKPTEEEMKGIPHHLIDVAEPDSVFTAAEYKKQGRIAIDEIFASGKIPIVCGGTGFYARALLEGLSIPEVAPNQELRQRLHIEAEEKGNQYLHNILAQKDPEAAAKIKANDRFRIIRALEVIEALSIPFSMASKKEPVPFAIIWIGLTFEDRSKLKEKIIERLKIQIEDGLEAEVRSLYDRYGKTRSLQNAVTYKQFISYFEKEISYEEALEECIKHNYQLARKQLIWFRSNPEMNWLKVDETPDLLEAALEIINESKARM